MYCEYASEAIRYESSAIKDLLHPKEKRKLLAALQTSAPSANVLYLLISVRKVSWGKDTKKGQQSNCDPTQLHNFILHTHIEKPEQTFPLPISVTLDWDLSTGSRNPAPTSIA